MTRRNTTFTARIAEPASFDSELVEPRLLCGSTSPRNRRSSGLSRREALGLLGASAGFGLASAWRGEAGLTAAPRQAAATRTLTFPSGAVIRTVLRDVAPGTLGMTATLFHEHLSFEWARVMPRPANGVIRPGPAQDVNLLTGELNAAAKDGVGCIVDAGTTDVGRDVDFLKQIAARTSVHIVACGGLYMQRTYPTEVGTKSEDQVADDFVRDAIANRYGAFGEIGETPDAAMSPEERKVFRAVGKAHIRTNLPIFTHNAYGTGPNVPRDAGLRQLDAFESVGVKPEHVAIGHSCCLDDPSADIIKQIAKRGAFVGFDRVTGGAVPDDKKVAMILAFLEAGYADRLLLSSDYNFTARSAARPGYGTTLTVFVPKLRQAGVKDETIRAITVDNPRRFLAFVPKNA
jgi:predicted metal-dependent phosphotriesterase family hydrolase